MDESTNWTKSPKGNQVASITLSRPSQKGNLANRRTSHICEKREKAE
jgi:hypothetical protein